MATGEFIPLPRYARVRALAVEYATRNGLKIKGPGGREMLDIESALRWCADAHPVEWAAMLQEAADKKQAGVGGLR